MRRFSATSPEDAEKARGYTAGSSDLGVCSLPSCCCSESVEQRVEKPAPAVAESQNGTICLQPSASKEARIQIIQHPSTSFRPITEPAAEFNTLYVLACVRVPQVERFMDPFAFKELLQSSSGRAVEHPAIPKLLEIDPAASPSEGDV